MEPSKNSIYTLTNPFLDLTWMDIQEWAGSSILSRGKSYQRSGSVSELGITKENELVAWVEGSAQYSTMVSIKQGKLHSRCTCPYGFNCKHGVAVVIEYLELQKKKTTIPVIGAKDKRISLIRSGKTVFIDESDSDDDDWNDEYDSDFEEEIEVTQKNKKGKSANPIDAFLKGKSHDELVAIINDIAASYPEVNQELSFKAKLTSPSVTTLVKTVSKEIDKATSEPGWSNHWDDSGYIPDYSRVKEGLQKLFDAGNYDDIVTLGKNLYTKGMEQVEQSHDEGETRDEICDTLSIVFEALKKCSLANVDKIEQAIDWDLTDEYSLTSELEVFWKKRFKNGDWATVADRLLLRLQNDKPAKDNSEFSRDYNRDKLTDQIINALEHAGRSEEILDLCIREAPITKSYDRLVTMLRKSGKTVDAEEWIRKGIKATQENHPGIASALRRQLLEIYMDKRDWPFCAAMKADDFFQSPSLSSYKDLQQACEKAKQWELVRPASISFLTRGDRPESGSKQWPLPQTGIASLPSSGYLKPPYTTVLIEIALFEKDIDEALRLYDESEKNNKRQTLFGYGWGSNVSDQIADAVKDKFPDRSIGIWKKAAEDHIARTNPNAYSVALGYLNRISKVMIKTGREKEFWKYIADIRASNKRKIRLVEMLDGLTGKRIIDE